MRLNIYIISHPIIKLLSNSIIYTKNDYSYLYHYKYIGLLLIYEIMRKYLIIQSVYIKKVYYIRQIYQIGLKERYYIITDIVKTYNIITDIKLLMPDIEIININNNNTSQHFLDLENIKELSLINYNKNVIILDSVLYESTFIDLITYIIKNTTISINNIQIACLACYNELLDKLGYEYPNLNVYTTKIIK